MIFCLMALAAAQDAPATEDLPALIQQLEPMVATSRGWTWKSPVVQSIQSVDQMKATMRAEMQTPPEDVAMLKLLGLLPSNYDLDASTTDLLGDQVAGYYDPESKKLVMIDRWFGGAIAKMLLVHELAHALDDQYMDLNALMSENLSTDTQLAAHSVAEGSATLTMMAWMFQALSDGSLSMKELLKAKTMSGYDERSLDQAPSLLKFQLVAPYLAGANFLATDHGMQSLAKGPATWLGERMLSLVNDPPVSMEQILHPEKFFTQRELPVEISAALPHLKADTLGELGCMALLDPKGKAIKHASIQGISPLPACTGWGGDALILSDMQHALWITAWDTPEDRHEFLSAWKKQPPGLPIGERAWVAGLGMTSGELALVPLDLQFTQGGADWKP